MNIYFDSEKASLKIKWQNGNSSLDTSEYINYWVAILKHVEVLKPSCLIIDASELEYRKVIEVNTLFNDISRIMKPENIALVKSNNILGAETVNDLMKNCPIKGHKIFNDSAEEVNCSVINGTMDL